MKSIFEIKIDEIYEDFVLLDTNGMSLNNNTL